MLTAIQIANRLSLCSIFIDQRWYSAIIIIRRRYNGGAQHIQRTARTANALVYTPGKIVHQVDRAALDQCQFGTARPCIGIIYTDRTGKPGLGPNIVPGTVAMEHAHRTEQRQLGVDSGFRHHTVLTCVKCKTKHGTVKGTAGIRVGYQMQLGID